jgi:hypothetical protein
MFYGEGFEEMLHLHYHHCLNCKKDETCYILSCITESTVDDKHYGVPIICSVCKALKVEKEAVADPVFTPEWFAHYNSREVFNGFKK